jgi:glutamyl-tRNA synthetase
MKKQENSKARLRIAPSPTGYPHIGTLYQALFNFAFARKHKGEFIVRIEDTDRARFVEGAEDIIFKTLDWAGLIEDESPRKDGGYGPYRQSERLEMYHKYAQELLDKDKAYYDYYPKKDAGIKKEYTRETELKNSSSLGNPDPPKSIKEMIAQGDWIIRMRGSKKPVTFKDGTRGNITFGPDQITEQVLIKSDGFPTYHLAVVVDDHEMKISHVVRGEEWISSTPKHVLLYEYFGWDLPLFFHTPDLRNPDKSKLSKRQGHTNVNWYKEEGYLPEAILNFLALLGWSHPQEKEIFPLKEFIELFNLSDIRPVGPIFDVKKLEWMNGIWIRNLAESNKLKERLVEFYKDNEDIQTKLNNKDSDVLINAAATRMRTLKDFKDLVSVESQRKKTSEEKVSAEKLQTFLVKEMGNELWENEKFLTTLKSFSKNENVPFKTIYFLLSGKEQGIGLLELNQIYGKDFFIDNLKSE